MRRVKPLSAVPPLLSRYIALNPGDRDWENFRKYNGRKAYDELKLALTTAQEGLCCYCEINLIKGDSQIEHFHPKNPVDPAHNWTIDPNNLMAACCGGTNGKFQTADSERFTRPCREHQSCGQSKGDMPVANIIDPRSLPHYPVVKVDSTGKIEADKDSCNAAGISYDDLTYTINTVLNLNSVRLRVARQKVYEGEQAVSAALIEDIEALQAYITATMAPPNGRPVKFWSTVACALGQA